MDLEPGSKMLATGFYKVGKQVAGRLLDSVAHDGYPEMAVRA